MNQGHVETMGRPLLNRKRDPDASLKEFQRRIAVRLDERAPSFIGVSSYPRKIASKPRKTQFEPSCILE
jgi:hypothetical protein